MKTENETEYYVFNHEPLTLNEKTKNSNVIEVYSDPLSALYGGRSSFCHKVKAIGDTRSPRQWLNWDRTPMSRYGTFEVDDFIPIEVIDAGHLMRRLASDLAIEASEPYRDCRGRGDGWTDEFIDYLETLDEAWRKENSSWYSIGPSQLMRPMVTKDPAYALLGVLDVFSLLSHANNKDQSHVRPEFKKRIDNLFDLRRVQRKAIKENGIFSYDD
jgi:hypothetical protein